MGKVVTGLPHLVNMQYVKENMIYQYTWPETSVASLPGAPGRTSFDPANGVQVLYIINYFCNTIGLLTVNDFRKTEELISSRLPEDKKSEMSVFNWLKSVYLNYNL